MRNTILVLAMFFVATVFSMTSNAAQPCDTSVNWGYVTNLTTLDTIRFTLISG